MGRILIVAMESDNILTISKQGLMKTSYHENCENTGIISYIKDEDQDSDNTSVNFYAESDYLKIEEISGDEQAMVDSNSDDASSIEDEEQEIDLKNMYMVIVSDEAEKSVGFNCDLCNISLKTVDDINKHLLMHDLEISKICEICNNIVDNNIYEIHMKLHNAAYKQKMTNNKVKCETCHKFVHKKYLKYHMKMHGTLSNQFDRLKQCKICNKLFSYFYLSSHMKRVHGFYVNTESQTSDHAQEQTKKCPICDHLIKERFFSKHVASHAAYKKQYICEQCGKEFNAHSTLYTHSLLHGADLKFKCQFCPYRGLHLGLLRVHVRTHTKDYMYECNTCNKTFLTKSNLSAHEKRHKPRVTFLCSECNKGFYVQRSLEKHYNTVHLGIRDEKCDLCGKGFGHRDGLTAHLSKFHNIKRDKRGRMPSYLKVENSNQSMIAFK